MHFAKLTFNSVNRFGNEVLFLCDVSTDSESNKNAVKIVLFRLIMNLMKFDVNSIEE